MLRALKVVRFLVVGFAMVLGLSLAAGGQDRASIVGTITDSSGAVAPGVTVTIKDVSKGIIRSLLTNEAGTYSAPGLPIGTYSVKAELKGFKTYERTDVALHINETVRVDVQLQVGQVNETVEVSAEAVAVQSENAEVSDTVLGKQVQNIATNGENFMALTTLVPGASSLLPDFNLPIPVGSSFAVSFNGLRTHHNYFTIDGAENYDRGCGGCITVLPSREAIQEFTIQTANTGSEVGLGSGGNVNIGIKSGTQDFHGELYEFLRNDILDANNYFNNRAHVARAPLHYNNFGWELGGPVPFLNKGKRKTFFFFSQEWRRLIQGTTINKLAVPAAERTGNFSGDLTRVNDAHGNDTGAIFVPQPINAAQATAFANLGLVPGQPFPGNIINPSLIDPNAAILGAVSTGILPLPNSGNSFVQAPSVPTFDREEIIRVDQTLTDKMQLMVHFINEAPNFQTPTTLWTSSDYPTVATQFNNPAKSAIVRLTWSISPSLVNEVSLSWDANRINLTPTGNFRRPPGLSAGDIFPGNNLNRYPGLQFFGTRFNTAISPGSWPWHNANDNYILRDQLSKSVGNHQLNFGGLTMYSIKPQDLFGTTEGRYTFDGRFTKAPYAGGSPGNEFADFLLGNAASYNELALQDRGHWRFHSYAAWFTDNWHATHRLTLNLGLRWEGLPHTYENFDRMSDFYPSLFNPSQAQTPNPANGTLNPNGPGFQTVPNVPLNKIIPGIRFYMNGIGLAGKNGVPRGLVDNHWDTFGPRVGFAYQLTRDARTVLRAGYGVYYERIQGNDVYNGGPNPPFSFNPTVQNTTLTNPGGGGFPIFPASIVALDRAYKAPTTSQYNFGIQRELLPNAVLTIGYVGTQGRHLRIQSDLNQPLPGDVRRAKVAAGSLGVNQIRPVQGFADVTLGSNTSNSFYNSLQANLRINSYRGLTFQAAYTYGHELDEVSGDFGTVGNAANNQGIVSDRYNPRRDYGSGDLDRRHTLVLNYVYDLPIPGGKGSSWVSRQILGGWQISGVSTFETGTPASVTVAGDPAGIGHTVRAQAVSGQEANNGKKSISQWFNTAAFGAVTPFGSAPGASGFGSSGRNVVRTPGRNNWDISFFKNFTGIPFPGNREGGTLQYQLEMFNTFNHTQFNQVGTVFGNPQFGQPTSAHDPRIIQMALKFSF